MNEADAIRLRHMLDASRRAISFSKARSRSDLDADDMLLLALVKCVEIIGEAASKVSPACRKEFETVPWSDIVAMRNRLIHGYFDINRDVVWVTVAQELPQLAADLERILF